MSGKVLAALTSLKGASTAIRRLFRGQPVAPKYSNNSWFVVNDSDLVVVFVHGLFSNSHLCWEGADRTGQVVFWPELVHGDGRCGLPSIFLGGYHTHPGSKAHDYGLSDCADELMRAFRVPDPDKRLAVLDKQNIVFVCHSAGGAVVRYLLDAYAHEFGGKRVGLVLLASPSYGSKYASLLAWMPWLTDKLAAQLAWGNDMLIDLDRRFRALVQSQRIPGLVGIEAFENHPASPGGRVVNRESAARYFANPAHLPGTDHSSISKPDCVEHHSHRLLIEFLTTHFSTSIKPRATTQNSLASSPARVDDPKLALFEFYTAPCEPYYFVREVDAMLQRAISISHVWLWGPSGCGKTSVVRRYAISKGIPYLYVSLSQAQANSSVEALRELWLTMYQRLQLPTPSELNLPSRTLEGHVADLVAQYLSRHIIHLDEIPINQEVDLKAFWAHLDAVITLVEERIPGAAVRFVISSLALPTIKMTGKGLPERLQVLEGRSWGDDELRGLGGLVKPTLRLPTFDEERLIQASAGSPRFFKKVIRSCLSLGDLESSTLETVIERTRRELS